MTWRQIFECSGKPSRTFELSEGDQYLRVKTFPAPGLSYSSEAVYRSANVSFLKRNKIPCYWCQERGNALEPFEISQWKTSMHGTPQDYYKISGYFKSVGNKEERVYQRITKDELCEIQ